jgi:hypothetical protein
MYIIYTPVYIMVIAPPPPWYRHVVKKIAGLQTLL